MERMQYTAEFKVKLAIETIKGEKIASELTGEYGVHYIVNTRFEEQQPSVSVMKHGKDNSYRNTSI